MTEKNGDIHTDKSIQDREDVTEQVMQKTIILQSTNPKITWGKIIFFRQIFNLANFEENPLYLLKAVQGVYGTHYRTTAPAIGKLN